MSDPLHLSGVELRRHTDPEHPVTAPEFEPYAHQHDLRELFVNEDSFLAVNDSPTGGGKTMSWLAPIVESGENALVIYPTNALIHDQEANIEKELDDQFPALGEDTDVHTITADSLRAQHAETYPNASSNGERLQRLLRDMVWRGDDQAIVLTNPDIFVMMRRHLYGRRGDPGSRVRGLNEFETIVVDEFHRAERKEQNTLLFLLDEMYDLDEYQCALSRIVLLSATPTERLERRFEAAMSAPYTRVTGLRGTEEQRAYEETSTTGWTAVMPPVNLDVRSAPTFGTADELLGADWEDTYEFAAREGRTVFILDGIHEVEQVYRRLDAELVGHDVVRIDGFHRGDLQAKLADFDVLVSNSAVEVGINFDIDRLVFSAHNRASFLQRLGRLRTETECQNARCYIPPNTATALGDTERASRVSRAALTDTLSEAYHDPRDPASFDWRYSAAEAYYHVEERTKDANSETEDEIRKAGWERITRHFGSEEQQLSRSDIERCVDIIDSSVEQTLQWYRGDSIQVLVYDRTSDAQEPIKTYNLFYLLRYGDVEFYPSDAFKRLVPDEYADDIDHTAPYVVGYCTYDGTIETDEEGYGRDVMLAAGTDVYAWLRSGDGQHKRTRTPEEVSGLSVDVDVDDGSKRIKSIEHLRDGLAEKDFLCYAIEGTTRKVKNYYDLGSFFFLTKFKVADERMSVAIGTDALYLHCIVQEEQELLEQFGMDI